MSVWPYLFKIALSIGRIQWISIRKTNCVIRWEENYPRDSVIRHINNWGPIYSGASPNRVSSLKGYLYPFIAVSHNGGSVLKGNQPLRDAPLGNYSFTGSQITGGNSSMGVFLTNRDVSTAN